MEKEMKVGERDEGGKQSKKGLRQPGSPRLVWPAQGHKDTRTQCLMTSAEFDAQAESDTQASPGMLAGPADVGPHATSHPRPQAIPAKRIPAYALLSPHTVQTSTRYFLYI